MIWPLDILSNTLHYFKFMEGIKQIMTLNNNFALLFLTQ